MLRKWENNGDRISLNTKNKNELWFIFFKFIIIGNISMLSRHVHSNKSTNSRKVFKSKFFIDPDISDQGRILDRVWQVFGGLEPETIPLIEEKLTHEKVQVVYSWHILDFFIFFVATQKFRHEYDLNSCKRHMGLLLDHHHFITDFQTTIVQTSFSTFSTFRSQSSTFFYLLLCTETRVHYSEQRNNYFLNYFHYIDSSGQCC